MIGGAVRRDPSVDAARGVADAIMYEGYVLYPYRRSSPKNRVRWQFGVLLPKPWIEPRGLAAPTPAGSAESWFQQTECLAEVPAGAAVHVRVRFLQLQRRTVERSTATGFVPAAELELDGERHVPFDEAAEREVDVVASCAELGERELEVPVEIPGGEDVEDLGGGSRALRRRWPITANLRLSAHDAKAPFPLRRLRVRTENTAPWDALDAPRDDAMTAALLATHTVVALSGGQFVSLLDPPMWASEAAEACENIHTFPVLVGEPGERSVMLSSPIILYDYPRVAPESPGNLFDATEIDEILSLRMLTLTDEEKREARATDPRIADLVDRTDGLPPEVFARLHGAIRSLEPPLSPDTVLVGGTRLSIGDTVRLRPSGRRTDAQDMFLSGKLAKIEKVLDDVDGTRYLAVTALDDPAAELHGWYGRFFHFSLDEVELP